MEPGAGEAGTLQGLPSLHTRAGKDAPSSHTVSAAPLLAKLGMVPGGKGKNVKGPCSIFMHWAIKGKFGAEGQTIDS